MKGFIRAFTVALTIIATPVLSEDEMRDFYAEPGMNPFRTSSGQDATESIDPFSGNIQLSYVDLSIPGNGGLDINITRYYNLPQSSPGYANPFGYGWTMHFGRITIGSGHAQQLCSAGLSPDGDTRDNPSIEMPSGGRELLVYSSALNDGTYISKSNWKAQCIDPEDYTRGIVATAPNGTAYYMREYIFMQGEDGPAGEAAPTVETWLTSQIVDAYDNSIDLTYLSVASGMKLLTRVDASDGRSVTFDYLDAGGLPVTASSLNARLSTMTANGETWEYLYAPFSGGSSGWGFVSHYLLVSLQRPDGTSWNYQYGSVVSEPDYNRLTTVTYPAGGEVNYGYQRLHPYLPNPDFSIFAIERKTQSNPGYEAGTWIYEFYPGSVDFADLDVHPVAENAGRMADFTRITTPAGVEHVYHVGYWALVGTHDILWQMGLKIRHQYLAVDAADGSLSLLRSVSSSWAFRPISDEIYRGGILYDLWDSKTYAPMPAGESVVLDGYRYTTEYRDHDAFGNPRRTTQFSIYPTENGDRITDSTYLNDIDNWYIGLPASDTTSQDGNVLGSVVRVYNAGGRLHSEDLFGVATQYDYTEQGDIAAVTDARGYTTHYSSYFRGTAQLEELPDGSRRSKSINPSGTVASKTSGRGHTTAFTYDGLNRLTGIDYPLGSDVTIDWNATNKLLTRGVYRETIEWDGFDRDIRRRRQDLASGNSYTTNFDYDELGRRVFASDINSSNGTGWEYDAVGRTVRIINQDGTYNSISYEGAHRELHRDENHNVVDYRYQVYGSPENRYLSWTISPEGVVTHLTRDALGNIASVFQGGLDPDDSQQYLGYIQSFNYNERLQLTSVDSPADIGLTSYGRDIAGNMTSRQVGAGPQAVYSYDAMNRLALSDYVDDALDVTYTYDQDGKPVSIVNAYAARAYDYDQNGNLVSENLEIGSTNYQVSYAMDALDNLSLITYPSGRTLDYAPDAQGRPTRATPYVTDVAYHPDGSVQRISYANGHTMEFTRTVRNQADTLSVPGLLALDYDYDPAGNVTSLLDLLNPSSSKAMSYDGLHRLKSVTAGWGTSSYEYDFYSNLIHKSDPARQNRSQHYQYLGLVLDRISYSGASAQRGFSYDDFGNITYSDDAVYDGITGAPLSVLTTRRQLFDDAGNMVFSRRAARDDFGNSIGAGTGSFSSEYDGSNNRIRKINHSLGNRTTEYVYSEAGLLLGEYDEAGTYYGNEYFYLGTKQVATAKINSPPLVDAGESIQTYGGLKVNLSATQSDLDGEVVAVAWTQVSGPEVTLADASSGNTSFISPMLTTSSTVVLQYSVTDDRGAVVSRLLEINVGVSHTPTADAGADIRVLAGAPAQLDGSGSFDTQGPLSYRWTGPGLSDANSVSPLVQPAERGFDYSIEYTLTVTNTLGEIALDTVNLRVLSLRVDDDADGLPDGWEVLHFGSTSAFSGMDDPDGDGVSNQQEFADATNPVAVDMALQVENLGVIAGNGRNVVAWQRSAAAASYFVYWTSNPGEPFDQWQRVSVTERFFEHTGLNNDVEYYYAVVAVNAVASAAASPIISGIPGSYDWRPATHWPDVLLDFETPSIRVAANRFGDTVILAEKYEQGVYRLYVWQRAFYDSWNIPELISEAANPHHFVRVDIDDDGNVLASWADGIPGARRLHSAYRRFSKAFGEIEAVESYTADSGLDADVVGLSHLEFTQDGHAYICWLQNRLQVDDDPAGGGGASALVSQFDPLKGWSIERNLEAANNIGSTRNLSCDVSVDGNLVTAWERYNSFDPQSPPSEGWDHDVWVAAYSPDLGWVDSETVEFIKDGSRDAGGLGVENHLPKVAVNNNGRAMVIWFNETNVNIESIEFDFGSEAWLPQETLESRGKQIAGGSGHQLASSHNGDLVASWGGKFRTRSSGAIHWDKSESLPADTAVKGIDELGQVYSIGLSGGDVVGSRYIGGTWMSSALSDVTDTGAKRVLDAGTRITGAVTVHWASGSGLSFSSDEPGQALPIENLAPVANAGDGQIIPEGDSSQLDGSASQDVDGEIVRYLWEQIGGTVGTFSDPSIPGPGFVAPQVSASENLVLRLTVTDDDGASASDRVTITVLDDSPDTTPPITSFADTIRRVKGSNRHTIDLQASELATVHFRFSGQGVIAAGGANTSDWQVYVEPIEIRLDKKGAGSFDFFAQDLAGNVESTQTELLQ